MDRARANTASLDALNTVNLDLTTFNDWFTAYVAGNRQAMAIVEKRFDANYRRCVRRVAGYQPGDQPGRPR